MIRVLHVDDEPDILHGVKAYLEDEGMEVSTAGSAEEALAMVQSSEQFDAIIFDLRLPGMSGDEAVLHLHSRYPEMKYFICTGSMDFDATPNMKSAGLSQDRVFYKPLKDMSKLAAAIHRDVKKCGTDS